MSRTALKYGFEVADFKEKESALFHDPTPMDWVDTYSNSFG